MKKLIWFVSFLGFLGGLSGCSRDLVSQPRVASVSEDPCEAKKHADVSEKIPSENAKIRNLHSMGTVNGFSNIFRSASPVLGLAVPVTATPNDPAVMAKAKVQMEALYAIGVRTIVSLEFYRTSEGRLGLEDPSDLTRVTPEQRSVLIEKAAAEANGIRFMLIPILNDGPNSLKTMTDAEVLSFLEHTTAVIFEAAKTGGVDFHCTMGHDRTGLVAGYLRMKYQGWTFATADFEMRQMGHDWPLFSPGCKQTSWQEDHLKNIFHSLISR